MTTCCENWRIPRRNMHRRCCRWTSTMNILGKLLTSCSMFSWIFSPGLYHIMSSYKQSMEWWCKLVLNRCVCVCLIVFLLRRYVAGYVSIALWVSENKIVLLWSCLFVSDMPHRAELVPIIVSSFTSLVIRGVSSLVIAQTQVSAPLNWINSQPVIGYRKGRAIPCTYVCVCLYMLMHVSMLVCVCVCVRVCVHWTGGWMWQTPPAFLYPRYYVRGHNLIP